MLNQNVYYTNDFIIFYRIDATFMCYAIDLDSNTQFCEKAHKAFSNFN